MRRTIGVLLAVLASGCATQFTGAPKVKNGPSGCKATCGGWQMDLVGMVKMGEYSDGCICQVRTVLAPSAPAEAPPPAGAPSSDASGLPRGLAGLPAVAGVYLQMQAAAAAAAQQSAAQHRATSERYPPGSPMYPGRY